MARRKKGDSRPYRLIHHKGGARAIDVVFSHIPGKRFSSHTTDDMEAIRWAEAQLRKGGTVGMEVPTLAEFSKDFYTRKDEGSLWQRNESNGRKYTPMYYIKKQQFLETQILPYFGKHKITAITQVMVEDWLAGLRRLDGGDMASSTKNQMAIVLKLIMDDAVRHQIRQDNPVRLADMPRSKTSHPGKAFDYDVQDILFPPTAAERVAVWGNVQKALFFSIMYDTGFRPGEVLGLQYGDVWRTRGGYGVITSHSIDNYTGQPKESVKTSGKGLEKRAGLLDDVTAELLSMYMTGNEEPDTLIFLSSRGNPMRTVRTNAWFHETLDRLGLDVSKQYNLRHTFLTDKKMEMDDDVLSLAMGHKNGTLSDYDHRREARILNQLEQNRDKLMHGRKEPDIIPFVRKAK